MSLIRIGTPRNGAGGRCAAASASARARSYSGTITAPSSALDASMRAIAASTSSRDDAAQVLTSSACAVASSWESCMRPTYDRSPRARAAGARDRADASCDMPPGVSAPSGKRALVTGGGRGIGEAIARGLAAAGVRVTVCGRGEADLKKVAAEIAGDHVVADLTDRASTDRMLAELGTVDILVNNAG